MKHSKLLGNMALTAIVSISSLSGAVLTNTPVSHANVIGDLINSIDGQEYTFDALREDGNIDGEAYVTFKSTSSKISLNEISDLSAETSSFLKSMNKFKLSVSFSDTDEGCSIYYQVVDKAATTFSEDDWKKAVPTATGLMTQKTFQFYITSNMQNKKVIIKIACDDGRSVMCQSNSFIMDTKKPIVTGVKNGVRYTKTVTIKFSDKNGIKSAKLNGATIKSGKKVRRTGDYKLVVTDKAGNKKTVKFKVKKKS